MAQPLPEGTELPQKSWFFDGFQQGNDTFSLATELSKNSLALMKCTVDDP
jgi:hypothetical protein